MSELSEVHAREWRDPAQVIAQWQADVNPLLLRHRVRGDWWQVLEQSGVVIFITREYEHLVMAVSAAEGRPDVSYLCLPHPSGLVVDREAARVHIASTRNPNQVFTFAPATGVTSRDDIGHEAETLRGRLVPVASRYYPGSLYLHDLALVGGVLHANAVGENAVVRLDDDGAATRVWWPRCIEVDEHPLFTQNHLQLNSIAAGAVLEQSYFSASCDTVSHRRPGHRNFPVDGRGVVFSGDTREPMARGLTRPHSARLRDGVVWVDNSGYGELVRCTGGGFDVVARLPGWTRGLSFVGDIALVGTSRVIPRFRMYAPGLEIDRSVCAVHAVDTATGRWLGSMEWPAGNQIFAVDWADVHQMAGFPFAAGRRKVRLEQDLFYTFAREGATRG